MAKYEVAILVCRTLAIYCFIAALNSLQMLVFGVSRVLQRMTSSSNLRFGSGEDSFWTVVTSSAPSAIQILLGIALWLGAPIWARFMLRVPVSSIEEPVAILPTLDLLTTLKTASLWFLGFLALLQGVPNLAQAIANYYVYSSQMASPPTVARWMWTIPSIFLSLTQICFGLVLLALTIKPREKPKLPPAAPEPSPPS